MSLNQTFHRNRRARSVCSHGSAGAQTGKEQVGKRKNECLLQKDFAFCLDH
jgi:hypothetical protein